MGEPLPRPSPHPPPHPPPTVGVICPLERELTAVLGAFDEEPQSGFLLPEKSIPYFYGKIGVHDVIATVLPFDSIGLMAANNRRTALQQAFPRLRYHFIVGIAGGIPNSVNDIRLGDVVIANCVCKSDAGKWTFTGFELQGAGWFPRPAPDFITNILPVLNIDMDNNQGGQHDGYLAKHLASMRNWDSRNVVSWTRPQGLEDILFESNYACVTPDGVDCKLCDPSHRVERKERPTPSPQIHRGMVASSDAVVKNGDRREKLRKDFYQKMGRHPLAIEMEAAGLDSYAVVRGICDYADSHKNKEWQDYAAATAAACFRLILLRLPEIGVVGQTDVSSEPQVSIGTRSSWSLSQASTYPPLSPRTRPQDAVVTNTQPNQPPPLEPISLEQSAISGETGATTRSRTMAQKSPDQLPSRTRTVSDPDMKSTGQRVPPGPIPPPQDENLLFDGKVQRCVVKVKDLPLDDTPTAGDTIKDVDMAEVRLIESKHDLRFKAIRTLEIHSRGTSFSLWIPSDGINTKIKDCILSLSFSDCRKDYTSSLDGSDYHKCVYDPAHPNTEVELTMEDPGLASKLQNCLLHREPSGAAHACDRLVQPDHPPLYHELWTWRSPQSLPENRGRYEIVAIRVGPESSAEIFYGGVDLDFDILQHELGKRIQIRQLQKVEYKTFEEKKETWALWPPPWMDRAIEGGGPKDTYLKGSHSLDLQPCDLEGNQLSHIQPFDSKVFMQDLTGWRLEFCGFEIAYKISKGSGKATVSVWTKDDTSLRILCRMPHDTTWVSSTLQVDVSPTGGDSIPLMEVDDKRNTVRLGNLWTSKGSLLVRSTLNAHNPKEARKPEIQEQTFQFKDTNVFKDFARTIEPYIRQQQEPRSARTSADNNMVDQQLPRRGSNVLKRLLTSGYR